MKIYNCSKQTVLGEVCGADRFLLRLFGMIFQSPRTFPGALWLRPCNSIHTFGMRFPIDVLFLDRAGKVLKIDAAVKPFRVGPVCWQAHAVVESFHGCLDLSQVAVGDRLDIRED